jgi:hypothetical protein
MPVMQEVYFRKKRHSQMSLSGIHFLKRVFEVVGEIGHKDVKSCKDIKSG